MLTNPRTLVIVALVAIGGVAATAQDRPHVPTISAPTVFLKILDAYDGWKPESTEENFGYSISNVAFRSHEVTTPSLRTAARNWLFMQTSERFDALATTYGPAVKSLFGEIYLTRGVHVVFSIPYDYEVDGLYTLWTLCMAAVKWTEENEYLIGDNVLRYVSNGQGWPAAGRKGECLDEFSALSRAYGVASLTVDDLQAVGFLHRRFLAHANNPKFLPAEKIRHTVSQLFDPNQ